MGILRVAMGSRDVSHKVWGDLCGMVQAGSSPSALRGSPMPASPMGSPGAGAAPALLEQRLPKERHFLESKGLRAGAVCEPCWEAEVIRWEMLGSLEPPFLQGPAQRPVSSGTNSSVGQAELESAEQGSWGSASMAGASWLQPCVCTRVTNPLCPQPGTRVPPKWGKVGVCATPRPGNAQLSCFLLTCFFICWQLSLTSKGHQGQWGGVLGHSGSLPGCSLSLCPAVNCTAGPQPLQELSWEHGVGCVSQAWQSDTDLRKQRKLPLFSALFNNQRSALFIQDYNWNDNSDIHCASSETHS